MSEFLTKVTPYKKSKRCDMFNCKGEMIVNNDSPALLSNPVKFLHICDTCGFNRYYNKAYPFIIYETVVEPVAY